MRWPVADQPGAGGKLLLTTGPSSSVQSVVDPGGGAGEWVTTAVLLGRRLGRAAPPSCASGASAPATRPVDAPNLAAFEPLCPRLGPLGPAHPGSTGPILPRRARPGPPRAARAVRAEAAGRAREGGCVPARSSAVCVAILGASPGPRRPAY